MSYLVLARRWRPNRFSEIVGQPHVTKTLLNSLRKGRIAHAYLFSGPRGVGKTTAARILTKALNCLAPDDFEPCGKCENCDSISNDRFIDSIEIDAASNRGIDDIKQLREGVKYTPVHGKAKTYIIDEVHMLTDQAFNALLKTLEEPPEHAFFCLATTDPQKVPATILSRCQRFDFRRVSISDIRAHLEKICKSDKIEYDIEALDLIARKADGSVRDSLSILDQIIAFTDGKVIKQEVDEVLGEIKLDLYFRTVELINNNSAADAIRLDEELASFGTDPQDFILGLETHLMQLLQVKSIGVENVEIPPDAVDRFTEAAASQNEADLIRMLQYCNQAEVDIRRKFNPRTRIQLLLLKFATMSSSVVLSDLMERIESGKVSAPRSVNKPSAPVKQPPETQPVTPEPKKAKSGTLFNGPEKSNTEAGNQETSREVVPIPDDPVGVVQKKWNEICDNLAREHNSSGMLIKFGGYPMSFENGYLTIRFGSNNHLETARKYQSALHREIASQAGNVKLNFEVGELPERAGLNAEDENDPAVKILKEQLGAEPID